MWARTLREFTAEKRGRASDLARYLKTSRQNVSRWLASDGTRIPAWAAVHANIWYQTVVHLGSDKQ